MTSTVRHFRRSLEVGDLADGQSAGAAAAVYVKLLRSRSAGEDVAVEVARSTSAVALRRPGFGAAARLPRLAPKLTAPLTKHRSSLPHAFVVNWAVLHERSGFLPEMFSTLLLDATSPKRVRGEYAPLSAAALSSFALLWARVKDYAVSPILSITPAGGVVAEWFMDPDNSVVVLSDRQGDFAFSVFRDGVPLEDVGALPQLEYMVERIERHAPAAFTWTER